jgi:hypothetical protein
MNIFTQKPYLKNPLFILTAFFIITLGIRLALPFIFWHTTDFPYQRYDPYIYVLKALEITHGDWSPIQTHAIGWPIALAGVFRLTTQPTIFENIIVASLFAGILSACAIFPFYALLRTIRQDIPFTITALSLFALSWPLSVIENSSIAMSEPLFIILFLSSLAFAYSSHTRPWHSVASGLCGGLAYATRPNGIFILPILLAIGWFRTRRLNWHAAAGFAAVSLPFLWHRKAWFGSAFDYGANSHYFADTYTDAWGEAITISTSFLSYIKTHGIAAIADKFILGGIGLIGLLIILGAAPALFGIIAHLTGKNSKEKLMTPLWIAITLWTASLIPVFHIYYNPRHILPLIPLMIIIGSAGIVDLGTETRRLVGIIAASIITAGACTALFFSSTLFFMKEKGITIKDGSLWARDLSVLLKGTVAIGNGSDILMIQFPDTRIGGKGMLNLEAPRSGIRVVYPGKIKQIDDIASWLKKQRIDYLILESNKKKNFSYAPDKYLSIYPNNDIPPYLSEIYSNYMTDSQFKIRAFRVLRNAITL